MEMVSASKMRQAQLQALASRQYSRKLDEVLSRIATQINPNLHPLLHSNSQSQTEAILVISTDRGLTGSLNTNLFKAVTDFAQNHPKIHFFTVGRLAKEFALKADLHLEAEFGDVASTITYDTAQPIASHLISQFLSGKYSQVHLAYMDFITTLHQEPRLLKILPIQKEFEPSADQLKISKEYTFEPSPQGLLDSILPYFIELTIYQSLLEARASEHSARMVAMKSASDNARDVVGSLTLDYNRSRQSIITSELSDIVTATMTIGG